MDTFLGFATAAVLLVVLGLPAGLGLAREIRIDRELRRHAAGAAPRPPGPARRDRGAAVTAVPHTGGHGSRRTTCTT
jgi:hypothetical protein